MTLPPDSPITPVTACTIPGRSGQDRVTTSLAFSVMGASLVRFIPCNEAGARFAGDATGLRWWGCCGARLHRCGRRCGRGYCWAGLHCCGRGCCLDGQRHGFTLVSRAAGANGQISRAGGGLAPSIRTLTRYSECGQPRPRTEQRVRLRNSGLALRVTDPGHHPSGSVATHHTIELRRCDSRQGIRLTLMPP